MNAIRLTFGFAGAIISAGGVVAMTAGVPLGLFFAGLGVILMVAAGLAAGE